MRIYILLILYNILKLNFSTNLNDLFDNFDEENDNIP